MTHILKPRKFNFSWIYWPGGQLEGPLNENCLGRVPFPTSSIGEIPGLTVSNTWDQNYIDQHVLNVYNIFYNCILWSVKSYLGFLLKHRHLMSYDIRAIIKRTTADSSYLLGLSIVLILCVVYFGYNMFPLYLRKFLFIEKI